MVFHQNYNKFIKYFILSINTRYLILNIKYNKNNREFINKLRIIVKLSLHLGGGPCTISYRNIFFNGFLLRDF